MLGSFKRFIQAWALVWAWHWPRPRSMVITQSIVLWQDGRSQIQKRHLRQVPKVRWRKPPRHLVLRGGYRGTKPRDKRFANQRTLRRMFRNM